MVYWKVNHWTQNLTYYRKILGVITGRLQEDFSENDLYVKPNKMLLVPHFSSLCPHREVAWISASATLPCEPRELDVFGTRILIPRYDNVLLDWTMEM